MRNIGNTYSLPHKHLSFPQPAWLTESVQMAEIERVMPTIVRSYGVHGGQEESNVVGTVSKR